MKKLPIKNSIKLNSYNIIMDAVERGVDYGYRRAFKHTDTPDEESIKESIYNGISLELEQIINWDN